MPADPAFAELLADKRSELRAPPAHVSVDDMRAGNKAYLITAPTMPIHAVYDRVIPGPAGPLRVRVYRPTSASRLRAVMFCHRGAALDCEPRCGSGFRWRRRRALRR